MKKSVLFIGTIIITLSVLLVLSLMSKGNSNRLSFFAFPKKSEPRFKQLSGGVSHAVIQVPKTGVDGKCDIFKIDQRRFTLHLKNSEAKPRQLSQWAESLSFKEGILINGGFFLENYKSCGFLVIDQRIIQVNKVDQDKSALIVVEKGKIDIRDLSSRPIGKDEDFTFALQSYPLVIKEGKQNITEDSGLEARRTMLGIDYQENIYIISMSGDSTTLYKLMQALLASKIGFKTVVNLDGGSSAGLFARFGSFSLKNDSFGPIPNILIFKQK